MKTLPIKSFVKEPLAEALDMPAMTQDEFNPPGVVQMMQTTDLPGFWYNKLNLSKLEKDFNLPSKILLHLIDKESKGKLDAVSKKGAKSLFGIMPSGVSGFKGDINSPEDTALFAARTLSYLIHHFGGVENGLAAYNWGMGNLAKKGLHRAPAQTRNYIKFFKEKGIIPNNINDSNSWGEDDEVGSWGEVAGMKPRR